MKTVYLVTSGCYSDYGIEAAFSTRELAQAYIDATQDKSCYDEAGIEEWDLDKCAAELLDGQRPWFIRMTKEGDTTEVRQDSRPGSDEPGFDVNNNLYTTVWGKTREHAVKVANERRGQIIAEGRWPEPKKRA